MSFKVQCDRCGMELNEPGGLMFSPPVHNEVVKWHVCVACWDAVQCLVLPQYAEELRAPDLTHLHALMKLKEQDAAEAINRDVSKSGLAL